MWLASLSARTSSALTTVSYRQIRYLGFSNLRIPLGKDMKANLSKGCPVCKTELSEHQILEKNLQMTENSATVGVLLSL